MILNTYCSIATSVFSWKLWKRPWCQLEFPSQDETVRVSVWLKKKLPTLTFSDRLLSYDLSLHCTDFFLETKNRSYCLHCLEVVEVHMEVKMMSEVVSLQANHLWHHRDLHDLHDLQTMETIRSHFCFEKNPYNVSSNLSLSRAHFSKVHVFCEVVEVVEVMEVMEVTLLHIIV